MPTHSSPQNSALIVDPDPEQRGAMRESLMESHLGLIEVSTLAEAVECAVNERPRLVLSELVLPDGSGFALCRQLRENALIDEVPVILISRWSSERDRILAFECGADDFLGKPYFQRELASRIKAVLRRSPEAARNEQTPARVQSNSISIDLERRKVRIEGRAIGLTPREFDLLSALFRHEGCVMSRTDLIDLAWNSGENPTERSVDAHIKSLRRKLSSARGLIETVRGLGYRFSEPAASRQREAKTDVFPSQNPFPGRD